MAIEDRHLVVWFTPQAIREHFEGDEEAEEILKGLSDEDLRAGAEAWLTHSDWFWEVFDNGCREILEWAKKFSQTRP